MSVRDLENYLWSDEIVQKLADFVGKGELAGNLLDKKASLLDAAVSRGQPLDDVKYIVGEVYLCAKTTLGLTSCGITAKEFAIASLAPLLTPDTDTHKQLKDDLFGYISVVTLIGRKGTSLRIDGRRELDSEHGSLVF